MSGNTANISGGAISFGTAAIDLGFVTVADNTANQGSGLWVDRTSSLTLSNSIIANNNETDCQLNLAQSLNILALTDDQSILENDDCAIGRRNIDPGIFPLANNRITTLTHALNLDSPAVNTAIGPCPETDQRRLQRNGLDEQCDIGAFEQNDEDRALLLAEHEKLRQLYVVPTKNGKVVIFSL